MSLQDFDNQRAIEFALDLEENEKHMAENAAMSVTLEQYGLEWGDQNDVLMMLSDGEWWLDDERRKEIAQKAAAKRWAK